MIAHFDQKFQKAFDQLPISVQKKVKKQIRFLVSNFFYPSLRTKRMEGDNLWEFRVDRQYRMTGIKIGEELVLLTIGMHDQGLGKK